LKSRIFGYLGVTALLVTFALMADGCGGRTPAASAPVAAGAQNATPAPAADADAEGAPPAQAAAPSDPNNPLIGAWHLSGYTPNNNLPGVTCQITDMTYTATQVTQVAVGGASSTIPVSYIPAPTKVAVVTDAGITNAAVYLVLDPQHVQLDAILGCTYQRVA
jgi:hypothetical protein